MTCTTREQSEILLKLGVSPDTADMHYHHRENRIEAFQYELLATGPTLRGKFWTPQRIEKLKSPFHKHKDGSPMTGEEIFDSLWGKDVPAWSLSELLALLPSEIKIYTPDGPETYVVRIEFHTKGERWYSIAYMAGSKHLYSITELDPVTAAVKMAEKLFVAGYRFNESK